MANPSHANTCRELYSNTREVEGETVLTQWYAGCRSLREVHATTIATSTPIISTRVHTGKTPLIWTRPSKHKQIHFTGTECIEEEI